MDMKLKIDPEFQNKIPPLTDAEFKQLEENILGDGEVREPIVVWDNTIVDGHNRWKIILANPWLTYRVKEMNFADKWEAFDWMYKNQLGRRNLTDEQRTFLLGKLYEARKHTAAGNQTSLRNADGTFQSDQNDRIGQRHETADDIAAEQKVGTATVKRAGYYARGIDAISEENPEFADSILKAEKKIRKKDVIEIGKATPEDRTEMIETLKTGVENKKKISMADRKELNNIIEGMSSGDVMEYTIDNLTEQIRFNADAFIKSLSNLLMDHCDLCNGHNREIVTAIDESITTRINQIKETFNNGTQL